MLYAIALVEHLVSPRRAAHFRGHHEFTGLVRGAVGARVEIHTVTCLDEDGKRTRDVRGHARLDKFLLCTRIFLRHGIWQQTNAYYGDDEAEPVTTHRVERVEVAALQLTCRGQIPCPKLIPCCRTIRV